MTYIILIKMAYIEYKKISIESHNLRAPWKDVEGRATSLGRRN